MVPEQTDNEAIDNRISVLLPLIDGSSTLEAIVDVCGIPRLDALRALHDLVQRGVVAFE
jgi:DNA-binding IclR family transcriptional regulator